ncbi:MAG TPA: hypothetical protein VIK89_12420 [Cytophagaceae bacterium]
MSKHIRCPKCEWEPSPDDKWQSECGNIWNTFSTYGQCPNCKKVYKQTQCHNCNEWSPHSDWYVDINNIKIEEVISENCTI